MKILTTLPAVLVLLVISCSRQVSSESRTDVKSTDSTYLPALPEEISYDVLYGIYRHENNGSGFFAEIEINPMGNDLQFALTLKQPGCDWQLQGTLAVMYRLEDEYAGFYDSETCRLVFTFFLPLNQIRLEAAGICVALPARCSLGGIYQKAAEAM